MLDLDALLPEDEKIKICGKELILTVNVPYAKAIEFERSGNSSEYIRFVLMTKNNKEDVDYVMENMATPQLTGIVEKLGDMNKNGVSEFKKKILNQS